MNPKFSIVIPTFNRPDMLCRALSSVSNQIYKDYEVVVVDDCSAIPAKMPRDVQLTRASLIRHERNQGAAAAYNSGISAARGELVSILDDDDEYHPDFLARTAEAFATHPEIDWCWTSIRIVDYGVKGSSSEPVERIFPEKYASDEDLFFDAISIGNGFGFTVRASCYESIGLYDTSFKVAEDAELIYRLLASGARPHAISEQLVAVHNHPHDRMTAISNDEARLRDCERIRQKYSDFIARWPKIDHQLRLHMDSMQHL